MADADVVFDLPDFMADGAGLGQRDTGTTTEPTFNMDRAEVDAMLDDFYNFDDVVADDMFEVLLQHQFRRSPSPPSPGSRAQRQVMDRPRSPFMAEPETIDLTAGDGPASNTTFGVSSRGAHASSTMMPVRPTFTEAQCLEQVLQVFPDISHEHVQQLFRKAPPTRADGREWIEFFIGNILEGGKYPLQKERRQSTKRKHQGESDDDFDEFEKQTRDDLEETYKVSGSRLLRDAFPDMRYVHIQGVFKKHKSVFKAYAELVNDASTGTGKLEKPRKKPRSVVASSPTTAQPLPDLPPGVQTSDGFLHASRELDAARRKQQRDSERQHKLEVAALAERQNEMLARQQGSTDECGCCCSEYPLNRMIVCEKPEAAAPHWLCWSCVKTHVETEIGLGRYRLVCFHVDGCTHGFSKSQLVLAVPQKHIDKLEKMEQEDDIRRAELEGLAECPFCDFKAICPPVEVDKEFRCENPECSVVSCRLCQTETHVPLSCEEMAKQKGVSARHKVEEAMTAALLRSCNKCKKTFIKDFGCNKMSCTGCGNLQCYVCGKDIKDYRHFGNGNGRCPLHDNTDKRHQDEVEKAEKAALERVRGEHPDLDEGALKINISEDVKRAEQENIRRINDAYGFQPQFPGEVDPLHRNPNQQDYEMQLMLLEQQNQRRLLMARHHGPGGNPARPMPLHENMPARRQTPPPPPLRLEPDANQPNPQIDPAAQPGPVLYNDAMMQQQMRQFQLIQQRQQQQLLQMQQMRQAHQIPRMHVMAPQQQQNAQGLMMRPDGIPQNVAAAGPNRAAPILFPGGFNVAPAPVQVQHHVHMFANGPPPLPMQYVPVMGAARLQPYNARPLPFMQVLQPPQAQPQPPPEPPLQHDPNRQ